MKSAAPILTPSRLRDLTMATAAYILPVVFVLLPLATFFVYSFFSVQGVQLVRDPTLLNYRRFFADEIYLPVFLKTCRLCLEVAGLTILFGYPVAYLLAVLRGRKKYVLLLLLLVPLLMSYIIKIYAIRSILGGTGFLNRFLLWTGVIDEPSMLFVYNLNAVLLTLSVLLLPFAILPIFLSLERIPRRLLEASSDLGGSGWQTFRMVTLPLSLPGVIAAASFVFVLALGDFLTPQMVGGQSGFTFGRIIYSQFGAAFNWPFGAALSAILAVVVMLAIVIGARFGNRAAARGSSL
ncbi:ABC transporter permease [Hypericibacter terrae]|jgi:spermidine/putrescine transport system permease protein|uniref:ABC transporter permease n=1 Tax=Hypericibacter terrae TaxID=2602015 RepID=A0A5J6MGU5_9PROT|nr:ABC transporter permease [Hypericibacter terrae]QEX16673.1 ABC transporter permease [Hypericibacter terrae]